MTSLVCRECGRPGSVPDIVPYLVHNSSGEPVNVWLHPACSDAWHDKYRQWRKKAHHIAGGDFLA